MSGSQPILAQHTWTTPLGPLHALWTERGLACTHMGDKGLAERWRAWCRLHAPDRRLAQGTPPREWGEQVERYFAGERKPWSIPLDLRGTEFRLRVWQALRSIPYGHVWTYAELAARIGQSGASRAVGGANGKNPIPVIVPCHRVVSKAGIGGFTGPMEWKHGLLEREGVGLPGLHSRRGG